jgi:transcriptional regulator NrdR family protein
MNCLVPDCFFSILDPLFFYPARGFFFAHSKALNSAATCFIRRCSVLTIVIKKNRSRQQFKRQKIERAVRKAIRDSESRVAREVASSVSNRVHGRKTVRASQLAKMALQSLKSKSPAAVQAWHRYVRRHRSR